MNQSMLYMKRILSLVVLLLVSFVGFAQAPSNYTNINGRYRWIAGMFDSTFSLPKGTTPSLRTGGSTNPGALFYRTTDSTVKYWTGSQWLTLSDSTRFVPYVGATQDVDLDTWSLNAKSLHVKGTAGNGHLGLKFQSATPNMSANESGIYADASGNFGVKIDNAYTSIFKTNLNSADRTYTFQNKSYTVADSADVAAKIGGTLISGYLTKATGANTIDTSQIYQNDGRIGIGTTSPTQKLDLNGNAYVNGQVLAGDTSLSKIYIQNAEFTPTVLARKAVTNTLSGDARTIAVLGQTIARGEVANRLIGGAFFTQTDSSNAQNISQLRALQGWTLHNGTGTVTNGWGSYNVISNNQTGTITNAYGSVSGVENRTTGYIPKLHGQSVEVWNLGGGTMDTVFGQTVSIYNSNPASTIGAVYGVSIGKGMITTTGGTHYWRNSGTINRSYGLYLDTSIDVGLTEKYAIYSFSRSNSYFNGNMGLGTTTPDSNLTVVNGAYFQRGVRMSGLPTGVGTKAVRINANGTLSVADTLANGISGTGTTNYIPKFTSSSAIGNSVIYESSSNIGIGTITPLHPLDVINSGGTGISTRNAESNYSILRIGTDVSNAYAFIQSGNAGTGTILPLAFRFGSNERMRLDASGNLLVGTTTTSPANANASVLFGNTDAGIIYLTRQTGTDQLRFYTGGNRLGYVNTASNILTLGTANFPLVFATNDTERMRLDASGNLGLGVTPSAWNANGKVLQIGTNGTFSLENYNGVALNITQNGYRPTSSTTHNYITSAPASNYYQYNGQHVWENAPSGTAGNAISFTQAMTLDASGRLGIGTTSPTFPLSIGTVGSDAVAILLSGDVSGNSAIKGGGGNLDIWSPGGDVTLRYNNSVGTKTIGLVLKNSSGNVGIGTTSPATALHVSGAAGNQIRYSSPNVSNILGVNSSDVGIIGTVTNHDLAVYTNAAERMRITSGGNVGIGTTSPVGYAATSGLLHINGSSSNSEIHLTNTSTGNTGLDGAILLQFGTLTALYNLENDALTFGTNNAERMRITSAGDLLINTTSDAGDYKLQVNGNSLISGTITTAAPSGGTAKPWKFGELVTTGVTVDTTKYIRVEIDGVEYYLATVTIN